ncbi:hypothetical protein SUGI_0863300 [Cryptomeria japonica]|nr:hypothetical protein SUGI_0863300 [Cryptomeria japonica]
MEFVICVRWAHAMQICVRWAHAMHGMAVQPRSWVEGAVTRARRLCPDEHTIFRLSVNCRPRLLPAVPSSYFGNGHMDGVIRERIGKWGEEAVVYRLEEFQKNCVLMGSSPRFEMYENDFGWGRPVAARGGAFNRLDGKISAYPGREGGGSVELEVCLNPTVMSALESDGDFVCPSSLI